MTPLSDALRAVHARAEAEGLLDVAYAEVDSPVGQLLAAATPDGLIRLAYDENDHDAVLDDLATRVSPRVLEATAAIPFGSVLTYTDVAARAGSPRGSRAAGNALGANPVPIVVPCHRIVGAGGALGGYTGGLERKRALLALESGGA